MFGWLFYTDASIMMGEKRFATRFILVPCFIITNAMCLLLTFFRGGTLSVVPALANSSLLAPPALSFAITLPRAFEVCRFLDVVQVLKAFTGGEIKAQSDPGDVDPPSSSSAGAASTLRDGDCALFDTGPSAFKTKHGRLGALTTSLL